MHIADRSFNFAARIIKLCKTLDQSPGINRTLANQLLRAGTSIGANIAEAQAAQSKRDFIAKMSIASKEARETHYWLRLLAVTQIIPETKLTAIQQESNELVSIITAIVKTSSSKEA
ncbi:four helix bundle protein [Verrucomicrobiaceae bacterium N1E253]|uniref:Four helix bundle protein n=1 Tax=Oceaniferula marina TaxID=2748318 RepID=A0A851GGZ3_9BACT|nr:four helix bundle protein [Oceaniferula marina]NWK56162.1 four helix bundle protein [Oceaniferula marina]